MFVLPPAHPEETPQVHRCAFVLHGLNTNPKRMDDLAKLAESLGYKSQIGVLSGHAPEQNDSNRSQKITASVWQSEFHDQWLQANKNCLDEKSQRLFIAYSLGALTGMSVFDQTNPTVKPTRMVLISPALKLRKKTLLIRAISWLPFGALPSVNHPDYRARDWTALRSYDALFALHDQWRPVRWTHTGKIPTLLVLAPVDELVDSEGLSHELEQKKINLWQVHWLNNDSSKLKPRYRHLIIDQLSQGAEQWQNFSEQMSSFLSTERAK